MHQAGAQLLLSFRVASARKKEILKPQVAVLVAMEEDAAQASAMDAVAGRTLHLQVRPHLACASRRRGCAC